MRTKDFRKIIENAMLIVVGAFFFALAFYTFTNLFFDSAGVSSQFTGAFMGAFFVFLFVRLGDGLTRFYERQLKHSNALVKLEKEANVYLNVISGNIFVIDDFIKLSKEVTEANKPAIYFNVLHEFMIDRDISFDLHNLDLINTLFSFEVGIEKMNNSIASANRFYSDIKIAFIQKNIDFDAYKANVSILKGKLEELRKFLVGLKQECKELGATTRLLMKDKPFLTRWIHFFLKKRMSEKIKNEIPKEVKKLEEEIKAVQKESEEKISSILKSK